ncbi:MAG: protein kinase [Polyangiaceae bacterium]|nr:protein kinase [Polyangiaceae bacterium]
MDRASQELTSGVYVGDVIDGKYRVDRVLGAGGMGMVVLAHHIHLDERVAIKVLLPEAMRQPEAVARFSREARAAVKIKSEHVARVSDVGTLPSGAPYMVMEFLEGLDLAEWLDQHGVLSVEQAVEFVIQACDAIADAHSIGIVHRDLKPSNLFCIRRNDGQLAIKVLDFGISKVGPGIGVGADHAMTRTTAVMGSPYYMSPEQVRSTRDVDARSDIWSIGVILFELLARQVPFSGESVMDLAVQITTNEPRELREVRPDVPLGLAAILNRCLQKDREARYPNVAELALALTEFAPQQSRVIAHRIARVLQVAAPGLGGSAGSPLPGRGSSPQPFARTPSGIGAGPVAGGSGFPPGSSSAVDPRLTPNQPAVPGVTVRGAVSGPMAPAATAPGTVAAWGQDSNGPAKRRGLLVLLVAAAGLLGAVGALAIVAVVVLHPEDGGTSLGSAGSADAAGRQFSVSAVPVSAEVASAQRTPSADAPVVAPSASVVVSAAQRPSPAAPATWRPAATRTPAASSSPQPATAATAPAGTPRCTPNFTLDAQGRKHFKPECFR